VFRQIDVLLVPTMPTVYTVAQVLADPIQLNSRLGTYTNFVNLLDLAGLAVPASMRPDRVPFGVTLLAPGGQDALLASLGRVFHADTNLPMGATGKSQPPLATLSAAPQSGEIAIAVVGAHLSGMPLNGELKSHGARFLESTRTAPDYRMFALATQPPKPGLLRVAAGQGAPIVVEIWTLPPEGFGRFVAAIPAPLGIGTLTLADGRTVKGFLAEANATANARDISEFGGWRAYVSQP
jgi:allophanate hydrolase